MINKQKIKKDLRELTDKFKNLNKPRNIEEQKEYENIQKELNRLFNDIKKIINKK